MASANDSSADARQMLQQVKQQAPSKNRALRIGGAVVAAIAVMCMGGATCVTLLLASPLLLLFSPILIPLAIVAGLAFGAFVTFIVFVSAVGWIYKYAKGRRPVGTHQIEAAKSRIAQTASQITGKTREVAAAS